MTDPSTISNQPPPAPMATQPEPVLPVASEPPRGGGRWQWEKWVGQRAAELFTVFVGVYAAFLLNAHQQHQQEEHRRAQLLQWLNSYYTQESGAIEQETANLKRIAEEFDRQVAAGDRPPLQAFEWVSSYNPIDAASQLQNGGYDLLEFNTIQAIKDLDSTLRGMVALLHHDTQLSDELILPNLDKGADFFYDPNTKQLRANYLWYRQWFKHALESYADLHPEVDRVLNCIHAEQAQNH